MIGTVTFIKEEEEVLVEGSEMKQSTSQDPVSETANTSSKSKKAIK